MFYPFNFKENERLKLRKMWRSIRENWANKIHLIRLIAIDLIGLHAQIIESIKKMDIRLD
jgi:hypothetical protein